MFRSCVPPGPARVAGLLFVLAFPASAWAGWLSEIFIGEANDGSGMPNAVEISGLAPGDPFELVVMDASNTDRLGTVRQIVRFEASQPVHLISDGDWPSTAWTEDIAKLPGDVLRDLAQLTEGEHEQFDLLGARRLHLYHGHTRIEIGGFNPLHTAYEQYLRDNAELLDVLTLADGGDAATLHEDEPVLNFRDGWTMLRPEGFQSRPADEQWLVGSPDADGRLTAPALPAKLTPGQVNPHFDDIHMPTPGSLAITLVGLGMLVARRGATCHRSR